MSVPLNIRVPYAGTESVGQLPDGTKEQLLVEWPRYQTQTFRLVPRSLVE